MTVLQTASYNELVNDTSENHLTTVTSNVEAHVNTFLSEPFLVNLGLTRSIEEHWGHGGTDLQSVESLMLTSFKTFKHAVSQVSVIGFGKTNGKMVGFRREKDDRFSLILRGDRTDHDLVIFDGEHSMAPVLMRDTNFDPRFRPWYIPAIVAGKPVWSDVYVNADENADMTMSASSPVYYNGEVVGVVVSDVKTEALSAYLREQRAISGSSLYIFSDEWVNVANSNYSDSSTDQLIGQRLSDYLTANAERIETTRVLSSEVGDERYFVKLSPYRDAYGIQWFIAAVISETELIGDLRQDQMTNLIVMISLGILCIIGAVFVIKRVANPIAETASQAYQVSLGNWEQTTPKTVRIREINQLVNAFNKMTRHLAKSIQSLKNQIAFDELTGLYSQQGFIERLDDQGAHANTSLMMIGLDNYREIYNSHGREFGHAVLGLVASRLTNALGEQVLASRCDTDNFVIHLSGYQQKTDLRMLQLHLRQVLTAPIQYADQTVHVIPSIGIAMHIDGLSPEQWIRNASIAKTDAGKTVERFCFFEAHMGAASEARSITIDRLHNGIKCREFVPFYQGIVCSQTQQVIGAEALARWQCPKRGLVSPVEFIGVAEQTGLIDQIGEQILIKACIDTQKAIEQGVWPQNFQVHVNISVDQLCNPNFIELVKDALAIAQLPAKNLALEITESKLMPNDKVILQNLHALKALGIELAIDDFGTGYSSLAYLHTLPVDCLKIDRAFIKTLTKENANESIASAVVKIAQSLSLDIVAEGIETEEQYLILKQFACPKIQGFYFSKPQSFEQWCEPKVAITEVA